MGKVRVRTTDSAGTIPAIVTIVTLVMEDYAFYLAVRFAA
jgi:hypothetical protein